MKNIILFRHAEYSWNEPLLNNYDKPLNDTGIEAAKKMGKYLSQKNEIPEIVISSTATRAKQTIEIAMKEGKWDRPISFNKIIYSGTTNDLLNIIKKQNDQYNSICIVGHEPKFSNFIDLSVNSENTYFPTATMAKIIFETNKWNLIEFGFGNLKWLISPKDLH